MNVKYGRSVSYLLTYLFPQPFITFPLRQRSLIIMYSTNSSSEHWNRNMDGRTTSNKSDGQRSMKTCGEKQQGDMTHSPSTRHKILLNSYMEVRRGGIITIQRPTSQFFNKLPKEPSHRQHSSQPCCAKSVFRKTCLAMAPRTSRWCRFVRHRRRRWQF